MDITDKPYPAHIILYIFMGMLDAMWQTAAYWMMGAMSNDLAKLAFLTGFCTLNLSHSGRPYFDFGDPSQTNLSNLLVLLAYGVQTLLGSRE